MAKNQIIGISVKHYSNQFVGSKNLLVKDFGESNTDKSTYRPDLSLVRAYQGAKTKTLLYDFSDGKDNGQTVQTFVRSKALDITEIETAEKRVLQVIEDKKKKAELSEEEKKAQDEFLSNLSTAIKGEQESTNTEQESTK